MTERSQKRAFTARLADPESWMKAHDSRPSRGGDAANFAARLTIDVTPDMHGQVKVAAFHRGETVADMLHGCSPANFLQPKEIRHERHC